LSFRLDSFIVEDSISEFLKLLSRSSDESGPDPEFSEFLSFSVCCRYNLAIRGASENQLRKGLGLSSTSLKVFPYIPLRHFDTEAVNILSKWQGDIALNNAARKQCNG